MVLMTGCTVTSAVLAGFRQLLGPGHRKVKAHLCRQKRDLVIILGSMTRMFQPHGVPQII